MKSATLNPCLIHSRSSGIYIVDSLPSVVYTDLKRLTPYYDFIDVGRTRIACRQCNARSNSRRGPRYNCIDTETKLPLRVDLLDRDGETLEQFRIVSFPWANRPEPEFSEGDTADAAVRAGSGRGEVRVGAYMAAARV